MEKSKAGFVRTVKRPYLLRFTWSGNTYPLSSDEAQNLIDQYPLVKSSANRVVLRNDEQQNVVIIPATLGGGPAFIR